MLSSKTRHKAKIVPLEKRLLREKVFSQLRSKLFSILSWTNEATIGLSHRKVGQITDVMILAYARIDPKQSLVLYALE